MLFNSLTFLVFFPVVLLGFYITPKRWRYLFLLAVSFIFYMWWNPLYILLLIFSIVITYVCGLVVGRLKDGELAPGASESVVSVESQQGEGDTAGDIRNRRLRQLVIAVAFMLNLGMLAYFKYLGFGARLLGQLSAMVGLDLNPPEFDILLPVGISFFTFQALGYIVDVYRGQTVAERNILKYALFVSFFPQMVAGPIERSKSLLAQVQTLGERRLPNPSQLWSGFILIVWGFFMKVVIADRAATLVDTVYDSYWNFGTFGLVLATFTFALQIYCDFASYSIIALGAARMMGFKLMENFNTPYFALSVREFWRRWHISLSTWFKDYLYIPLGGNRRGKVRKCLNLMIVFVTSGLWHGASLNFVAWGFLHGAFLVIGEITHDLKRRVIERLGINTAAFSWGLGQLLVTFLLTSFAWIFFRSKALWQAGDFIVRMFTHFDPWSFFNEELFTLGLGEGELRILFFAVVLLLLVDLLKWRRNINLDEFLLKQNLWFRWFVVIGIFLIIVIYGAYGPIFDAKQFIYFQF
jgi:D-alanyl-lipoteichoic acid acyltransferase DltB (MBOAT superfamily)